MRRGELGRGIINEAKIMPIPREIKVLTRRFEEAGMRIVDISAGTTASSCILKKVLQFHIDDLILQDDKLELLRDLNIMQ